MGNGHGALVIILFLFPFPFPPISARTTLKDALNFADWLRDRYRCT
ncbi:hypothetical protein H6G81_18505 [Scytonema hofmannii FACHB-248]|uniref:Uncharacterized protein n=1 Tax=Scytonema hofmannii FACHB-248 TaxID=1842502 RepID=A0ABR8GSM2_9CYAN|nr:MULTISPECIES: hypothetical protein [Nostocales]MBD2606467.1 hypothetical protein [Scytonema hofmannii FACHB-248]